MPKLPIKVHCLIPIPRSAFTNRCFHAYNHFLDMTCRCPSDVTEEAIYTAGARLKDINYAGSGIAYATISEYFKYYLIRHCSRQDIEQEARDFMLTQPADKFSLYRTIPAGPIRNWSDARLLERIYFEAMGRFNHNNLSPLFEMPKDSASKVIELKAVLREYGPFEASVLLYSEGLEAWVEEESRWVDRDTKVIITNSGVKEICLNTNDRDKYNLDAAFATGLGMSVINWFGDARKIKFSADPRKLFIYINGAMYHSQRPGLIDQLKMFYPNSIIVMVMTDLFRGRQRDKKAYKRELRYYGIDPDDYDRTTEFYKIKNQFANMCRHPTIFLPYGGGSKKDKYLVVAT